MAVDPVGPVGITVPPPEDQSVPQSEPQPVPEAAPEPSAMRDSIVGVRRYSMEKPREKKERFAESTGNSSRNWVKAKISGFIPS